SLGSLVLDKNHYEYYYETNTSIVTTNSSESNPDNNNSNGNGCNIIEMAAKYCPNLINFTSSVTISEIPQLITLFTLCPILETVNLMHSSFDDYDHMEQLSNSTISSLNQENVPMIDVDWLLEKMCDQKLSRNLRRLSIQAPWSYSSAALENYLTTCSPPLKSLELSYFFSDDHLSVLLRCLDGKLKSLKVETVEELSDELQVEALDKIEDFRVQKLKAEYLFAYL
ncbi:951_t:CDS:1, partial [Acaulospora colombiana]